MRDLPWRARFDGAFCVGNSFGYLDDERNVAFVRAVASALKPGARFVLETPMILENLLGHLQDRPWWKVGDTHLLVVNAYDATGAASTSSTRSCRTAGWKSGAARTAPIPIGSSWN